MKLKSIIPILLILMLLIIPVFAEDALTKVSTKEVTDIPTAEETLFVEQPTTEAVSLFDFLKPQEQPTVKETPIPLADDKTPLVEGETWKQNSAVKLDKGYVTVQNIQSNIKATTYTKVDNAMFVPASTRNDGIKLIYGSGEKAYGFLPIPSIEVAYSYTGNTLKETITLKEDKQLSFPLTLQKGSKLIPWTGGQFKIVADDGSGNTMAGLVLEKPFGIDANGNRVEMDYTYENGELKLNYNRVLQVYNDALTKSTNKRIGIVLVPQFVDTPIAYPLVIDPSWTVVGDHWTTTNGLNTIVMWNTTGTTTWTPPPGVITVQALEVAGGGAGGRAGGGGAAGGVITNTFTIPSYITITVPPGGMGLTNSITLGNPGGDAIVVVNGGSTYTAIGGTGGGSQSDTAAIRSSANGGSSGGAASDGAGTASGTVGTASQGNIGGLSNTAGNGYAGGGGGIGAVGASGADTSNGGAGLNTYSTFGISGYIAGGGAGYHNPIGTGGSAIGGDSALAGNAAGNGINGTGSGGGAAYTGKAGDGGSGIVVLTYLNPAESRTAFSTSTNQSFIKASTGFDNGIYFYNGSATTERTVSTSYYDDFATNTTYRYSIAKYTTPATVVAGTEVITSESLNLVENTYTTAVARLKSYKSAGGEFEFSFKNNNDGGSPSDFTGALIASQDFSNHYRVVIGNSTVLGTSNLSIWKDVAGTYTLVATADTSATYNRTNVTWMKVRFDPNTNYMSVWFRDNAGSYSTVATITNTTALPASDYDYGYFGFYSNVGTAGAGNLNVIYDNFTLKTNLVVGYTNIPVSYGNGYKPMLRGAQIGEYYNGAATVQSTRYVDDFNWDTSEEYTAKDGTVWAITPTLGYLSLTSLSGKSIAAYQNGLQQYGDGWYVWNFYTTSAEDVMRLPFVWSGTTIATGRVSNAYVATYNQASGGMQLFVVDNLGNGVQIGSSVTRTPTTNTHYKISVLKSGSNFYVYWNNEIAPVITGIDATLSYGYVGITSDTVSVTKYTSIQINALDTTSPSGISATLGGVPHGAMYASTNNASVSGYAPLPVQFSDVTNYYNPINPTLTRNWSYQGIVVGNNTKTVFATTAAPLVSFGVGNFTIQLNNESLSGKLESTQQFWVNVSQPAISSFTANKTGGQPPVAIHFTDTSTYSPQMWNWSVNNTVWYNYTSSHNLDYTFIPMGLHNVSLMVSQPTINTLSNTTRMNIYVNTTVGADFVGAPLTGIYVPQTVSFVDYSVGEGLYSWAWNFGDGQTSTLRNPTHQYTQAGVFTVSLTTIGLDGTSTKTAPNYVTVSTGNVFTANRTEWNNYGFPVQFTDSFPTGHLTWNWSFGDGYYNNSQVPPVHYYSVANRYTVNLTVTDAYGTNKTVQTNYINLTSDLPGVKSWLHMDGVAGGTTFNGEMGSAWTPTSVTTETSNKKFGTASALFNAAGDRLQTPSSTSFDFGTGDFTIEKQVYITADSTGDTIISRTSDGAARTDGWGIYDSTNTDSGWKFWAGATQTGTFQLTVNTWHHLAVERTSGIVTVYVDGIAATAPTAMAGNYDTNNPVVHGKPITGAGVNSAKMYLDEPRISNVARWSPFSPPPAPYAGDLFPFYPDPNPGSTLRFKTDPTSPPGNAIISNLTPRYRTIQIQNVNITNNISLVMLFNENHFFASGVSANATTFAGINFTNVVIDNSAGTVLINATRPGGFTTKGLTDGRASFADIRMVYWNYTPPEEDAVWDEDDEDNIQRFGSGYLGNLTNHIDFPVHNFINTNITVNDWITFSNFTVNNTAPWANEHTVLFTPENNFSANRYLWSWGDGTTLLSYNSSDTHIYDSVGAKTVSLTAYLWQNNSVTNTTTRVGYVVPVYNASWVHADFEATPVSGSVGMSVTFTDLSTWGTSNALSGRKYNWSFGDDLYSPAPYSSLVGSPTHVYPALGTYTVKLTVNNTITNSTMEKLNYIVISTKQDTTNLVYQAQLYRLIFQNLIGTPLGGLSVTVTPLNYTMPSNWTSTLIGISSSVIIQNNTIRGITGTDGSIGMPLLTPLGYMVNITGTAQSGDIVDYSIVEYPPTQGTDILISLPTSITGFIRITPTPGFITYNIYNQTFSSTIQNLSVNFNDPTGATNFTIVKVINQSGYVLNTTTYTGTSATSIVNNFSYIEGVTSPSGDILRYGFSAYVPSAGGWNNITETYDSNVGKSLTGSHVYDQWAAIIIIVLASSAFTASTVYVGTIGVGLMGLFFYYTVKWFTPGVQGTVFVTMCAFWICIGIIGFITKKGRGGF